jgi:hypothetical protein
LPGTDPKNCALLEFPESTDARGNLSFLENGRHIPFDIKRVFYLYDVPAGARRAAHALIRCQQCIIAIVGSLDVTLDDGSTTKTYHLDRPNAGLYVPGLIWRELLNFSADSVVLVIASEFYDPEDYFQNYADFRNAIGAQPA